MISFKLLISSLQGIDSSMSIKSQVLQLLGHAVFLHPFSFHLSLQVHYLRGAFLMVISVPIQVSQVGLQSLVHFDLHELFQALVLLHLQLNVGFLGDE